MNAEFIAMLEHFEKDKGIKREILIEAVQTALLSAAKKSVEAGRNLELTMDPKTGVVVARAQLKVVDRVQDKHDEIQLVKAQAIKADAVVGDEVWIDVTPKDLGRIGAQTARQAIMQRIRQAEKQMIYDEFRDRAGEIVSGIVRGFERQDVKVDLGKFEAILPNRERVQSEDYAIGDRIRAYVVAVDNGARGPEIILSRSHPNFVRRLFETEVAEIADKTVEIKSVAREAGFRTKVAVWSANEKVDPVGACVGMKGARVKNIVRELNNEKVDIIRWSADVKDFVTEACEDQRPLAGGEKEGRRSPRGQRPALARHRQARPKRPPHRPPHRLGDQHPRGHFRKTEIPSQPLRRGGRPCCKTGNRPGRSRKTRQCWDDFRGPPRRTLCERHRRSDWD